MQHRHTMELTIETLTSPKIETKTGRRWNVSVTRYQPDTEAQLKILSMETTTIAGTEVSRIGLGTWAIGGLEWGAKRPEQLDAVAGVMGWKLDASDMAAIDRIVAESVTDPAGLEYLTPGVRQD
jgi:hypothetical protein